MRKKKVIDGDSIGVNPFSINLKIPVTRVTNAKVFRADVDGVMHPDSYYIDKRECVKIYRFPGLRSVICNLSAPAHSLLMYVCMKIEHGSDYVVIDRTSYMKECNVKSVNTYKSGVNELIKYGFIATVVNQVDIFWINPAYFFVGNPVTKYPTKTVIKGEFTKL